MNTDGIIGRVPDADNEILLEVPKGDYMFFNQDDVFDKTYYLFDNNTGETNKAFPYKIVGIRHVDSREYSQFIKAYVSDAFLNQIQVNTHQKFSKVTIDFFNEIVTSNVYNSYLKLATNHWVSPGEVFISENENVRCDKYNCVGKEITITNQNLYYTESRTFRVQKTYNKKNFGWILDVPEYRDTDFDSLYNGPIYMNPDDYLALFNKGTYQMSVYVSDIHTIKDTEKQLQDMGNKTLQVRNTLVKSPFSKIIRVIKIIITVGFIFVLFFISYFIIKIIMKSRNIYFSVLRMLGSSKKVCLDLLVHELLVISNLSYFLILLFIELNRRGYYSIEFMNTVDEYFHVNDYILLYVIVIGMSLLISFRYARKIFKDSVMNTYREVL